MLGHHALTRQLAIGGLVFWAQGVPLGLFAWCLAVVVIGADALIATITQTAAGGGDGRAISFEQSKIMGAPAVKSGGDNHFARPVRNELGFVGMALFLAAVEVALFFWGAQWDTR